MDPNQQQPPGQPGQTPGEPASNQPEQTPGGMPPNQFPNQPASPPSQLPAQPQHFPQTPLNQASGQQFHQPPVDIPPIQTDQNNRTPSYSRPPSSSGPKVGRIVGIVIGAIVLVLVVGALLWFFAFSKSGIDKIADAVGMDCSPAEIQFEYPINNSPAKQALKCKWEEIEYSVLPVKEFREHLGEVFEEPDSYDLRFTKEDISGFCAGQDPFSADASENARLNTAYNTLEDQFSPFESPRYSELDSLIFIRDTGIEYSLLRVQEFEAALEEEGFMLREIAALNIDVCDYESSNGNVTSSAPETDSNLQTNSGSFESAAVDSDDTYHLNDLGVEMFPPLSIPTSDYVFIDGSRILPSESSSVYPDCWRLIYEIAFKGAWETNNLDAIFTNEDLFDALAREDRKLHPEEHPAGFDIYFKVHKYNGSDTKYDADYNYNYEYISINLNQQRYGQVIRTDDGEKGFAYQRRECESS